MKMNSVCLSVAVCGVCIFTGLAGEHELVTCQDAHIQKSVPNQNFGDSPSIKAMITPDRDGVKGYVMFDASALPTVKSVRSFTMTFTAKYGRGAQVYLLTDENSSAWSEKTLTWNNAPGNDPSSPLKLSGNTIFLGNMPVASGPKTSISLEWDNSDAETALVNALNGGSRRVTLVLVRNGPSRYFAAASRELAEEGRLKPAMLTLRTQ